MFDEIPKRGPAPATVRNARRASHEPAWRETGRARREKIPTDRARKMGDE